MNASLADRMGPSAAASPYGQAPSTANLADILERVLDKGIVIAGDIQINLLDIELLTIKLRLLVASVDKAKEMGIDWWEHDPSLSSGARPAGRRSSAPRTTEAVDEAAGGPSGALPAGASSQESQDLVAENERLRAEMARLRAAADRPEDER